MKKILLVVNSFVLGAVVLALLVAGSLLVLMFSTGEGDFGTKTGLFGSVFFSTVAESGGAVGITMGVANTVTLGILFAVLVAFSGLVQLSFLVLRGYRQHLIEEGAYR